MAAAEGDAVTDAALIVKLETGEFGNISRLFDLFLRPFSDIVNPKPVKKSSRSRTAADAANDLTTIRGLAKKFLPCLNRALSLIPKSLLTDPKPELDAIGELLKAYDLVLKCLEALASQLSCKSWFVYGERARMMHCLQTLGRYREAEEEGFDLLRKIWGLDGILGLKGRGVSRRYVPELGSEEVDSELAMLVVDIVVKLVNCISLRESKDEECYRKVLLLVGESRSWFRILNGNVYEKYHRALVVYLDKCTIYLVQDLSHFKEDLVYSFCSITLAEYRESSLKEQACKFASRIYSSLLKAMEKGSPIIVDILHCVLQSMALDLMVGKQNIVAEFLGIISCISTWCRNVCPFLHTSVAACLTDIADNFFQGYTQLASTLMIFSIGLRYNKNFLAHIKDQPKLVTLLEEDSNLKQLKSVLFSFRSLFDTTDQQSCSLSAHLNNSNAHIFTYFDALNYICHPFSKLVISNMEHILAEKEDVIPLTNLCVIHDAFLMLGEAHISSPSYKTEGERAEPENNFKHIQNVAVAAFILSLRTKKKIEKSVHMAEKAISDGSLQLQGLKFLFLSFYNIGVTLSRSKQLKAASEALKLCCRASWACVSLLSHTFIKNSHSRCKDISESDVIKYITDACLRSAFFIDIAYQCSSHDVKKEMIYCLENWSVVGTLIGHVSAPKPLVKQWVKIECELNKDMDASEKTPTLSCLLSSSSVEKNQVAVLLEQELLEYESRSAQSPTFCHGMQMKIIDILRSEMYATEANSFQRSKILMKKGRLLRFFETGTLTESIQCISEAIEAMLPHNRPHDKGCKLSVQDRHQLASAYCLRAFSTQEADPSSKKILEDVEAAVNIWLSLPEYCGTDLSSLEMSETAVPLPMLCHLLDLLSLKVHTGFNGNLYKLLIKIFRWRNIPAETFLPFLWKSRRLSHALCASPINEDFMVHLTEHVGEQCKTMEYWISCMKRASQNLILGFELKFSYLFVLNKGSYHHGYTDDEVKEAARNLTSNGTLTSTSIFLAGNIYHDLSERLVYSGKLIEGLFYAKEAHRLLTKLFHERFTFTIEQQTEQNHNQDAVEKQDYSFKNFSIKNTVAAELWSLDKDSSDLERYSLSPWNVLQCYIESTFQVGVINEMLGNSGEAENWLNWGQNICSSQGLPFLFVVFSCALGKLYRKKKIWSSAVNTLKKGKNVLSDCMTHITCMKCKSMFDIELDLQLGDLFRSQFTRGIGNSSSDRISQAENLYRTGLNKLKLPDWRNAISCPINVSKEGTKTWNRKPKEIDCNELSASTSNTVDLSASSAACKKPTVNLERKSLKKTKETSVSLHPQQNAARVTRSRARSSQISNPNELVDVQNISDTNDNGGHASLNALSKEISYLDINDHMLHTSSALPIKKKGKCWQSLLVEVLDSGLVGSFVSLKWEFLRRRLSLKLLMGIGKCLHRRGQIHGAHEVYCESIAVMMSENHLQYTFSATRLDEWFDLINEATYGDVLAVERAAVLYNICLHSLMTYHTQNARDVCCDIFQIKFPRIVSWLKLSFVLCREVPNLFQKVSRLLASLHVLSASTELFPLPAVSQKPFSDSHWAAYFHQASIGTHFNYQLLCCVGKSFSENPANSKVDISTSSAAAQKWDLLRPAPASVQCLEEFVLNFYQGLPSATVLCFSLLGGKLNSVLRELLGYPSTVNAWTLLSRFNSINQPVVTLQPVDSVLDEDDSTNSVIRNLFGDDNKNWQCPWGSTVVDEVVPIFRELLKENYASASDFPSQDTKNNRSLWWGRRKKLDQSLNKMLRNLEGSWFGNWKYLFLGGWSDCNHLDSITKKLTRDLKRICKLNLGTSLLKVYLGGASYALENGESFLRLNLENGCFAGRARNDKEDMEASASTPDSVECLSSTGFNLILDATNELENEPSVHKEPIILVLDLDVQMLPLESMPILRNEEVYRMPSVGSIALTLDRCRIHQDQIQALASFPLIDPLDAFYLLNPSGDLSSTQQEFEKWFTDQNMEGRAGVAASVDELFSALKKHDLFIYFGHGSGAQYTPDIEIQKLENCAATLLMGCSSGSLHLYGSYIPRGMPLSYLMAGSPAIIANLWDVTDKDIDRFGKAILEAWFTERSTHHATSEEIPKIGSFISKAREACILPYLIGAAPVCYGVPTGIWRKKNT